MKTRISVLVLLATMIPAYASAQDWASPGERVRVHLTDGGQITGVFVSRSIEEVQITDAEDLQRRVAPDSIAEIERSIGKKGNALRGGAIGFIGAAVLATATYKDGGFFNFSRSEDAMFAGVSSLPPDGVG